MSYDAQLIELFSKSLRRKLKVHIACHTTRSPLDNFGWNRDVFELYKSFTTTAIANVVQT